MHRDLKPVNVMADEARPYYLSAAQYLLRELPAR
jgi:hypothetical protein